MTLIVNTLDIGTQPSSKIFRHFRCIPRARWCDADRLLRKSGCASLRAIQRPADFLTYSMILLPMPWLAGASINALRFNAARAAATN